MNVAVNRGLRERLQNVLTELNATNGDLIESVFLHVIETRKLPFPVRGIRRRIARAIKQPLKQIPEIPKPSIVTTLNPQIPDVVEAQNKKTIQYEPEIPAPKFMSNRNAYQVEE